MHLGPAALEDAGRDVRERPVRAVDADAKTGEIRSEVRENMAGVLLAHPLEAVHGATARRRRVEQRLDLLLLLVDELAAFEEELHAVVFGRVVRRGDDDAEALCEKGDGGSRQYATEHRSATPRRNADGHGLFELRPGRARVAPDEHMSAPCPQRRGLRHALDEVRRQIVADDAPDTIRSEVPPCHLSAKALTSLGRRSQVRRARGAQDSTRRTDKRRARSITPRAPSDGAEAGLRPAD